ncbi:asialoglycoprotein receptor 1-like [Cyprinodon tularosa]|uniref:asialoglycoprotein receptor 1-like n=1 Tax=Cyprinodon tularosa TaxID=77115 RepID=UPI0018E24990|nr:asialoglycoprotein receptor 1-like [Cyprinodon tularosa]
MAEKEDDITYSSIVFKTRDQLHLEVPKKEEETVYDEVKIQSEATEKTYTNSKKEKEIVYDELKTCCERAESTHDTNALAVLLPDKEEEAMLRVYKQAAWCFGILFVSLLLGVIAVGVYVTFIPAHDVSELDRLKTNQTALLGENNNLTNINNKLISELENLREGHTNLTVEFKNLSEAFNVSESRILNLTGETQRLTNQNQELESEKRNLTEQIQNLENRWIEQNVSRAQWSINAYCTKSYNRYTCKPCQDGWLHKDSSCYAINDACNTRKTRKEAREDCRRKNADLVVVSDESEKTFVSQNSWYSSGNDGYWIGLKAEGNKWKWVDGSNETNKNWIQSQPNDNQCVISVMYSGWKSVDCSANQRYICEKKALSV